MSTQTITTQFFSTTFEELVDREYLSNVISALINVYQTGVLEGYSDIMCRINNDGDFTIYGTRQETPEEEARRLKRKAESEQEERKLLAELQAKYLELDK